MIVTSQPVLLMLPPPLAPRSEGVHLSSIIRCIATESGILKPEWAEELSLVDVRTITDQIAIRRICMGLAWEEWYIRTQLPDVVDHPGEMCVDGVYMTPDGEGMDTIIRERRPWHINKMTEIKLSFKSVNTVMTRDWRYWMTEVYDSAVNPIGPLTSEWMWMAQTKGYCYAANTNYCALHVLFVCGDYSFPIRPDIYRFDIEFTDEELELNWELMVSYKLDREELEERARLELS